MANKVKKILVVEDDVSIAGVLDLKLKSAGFSTVVVHDGEHAITQLNKNRFDLVLLDLIVPKKDGFDVMNVMKKNKDKTPVIILSNLSQKEDIEKAKKLGSKHYFVKSNTPLSDVVLFIQKKI